MSVVFCSRSSLVAAKIFCSSWLPLPAELTSPILSFQAERIHHDLLDFLYRCFWAVWMIFLYSSISSSKSIFGTVVIISSSFSSHLHRFLDASGLAGCNFPRYCGSPRTSPCLGRCCWLCSCLACCWLCSSRCLSSSLQIFVFFSLSSYACCFTFPSHHLLLGCGSVGDSLPPLALWLWFLLCCLSESLCGRLRLRGSFLASFQHHYSALRPS